MGKIKGLKTRIGDLQVENEYLTDEVLRLSKEYSLSVDCMEHVCIALYNTSLVLEKAITQLLEAGIQTKGWTEVAENLAEIIKGADNKVANFNAIRGGSRIH